MRYGEGRIKANSGAFFEGKGGGRKKKRAFVLIP